MKDHLFTQPGELPDPNSGLASATRDIVLFADETGSVVHAGERSITRLGSNPIVGKPFWEALSLDQKSLSDTLAAYPPGTAHEVGPEGSEWSILLRIMPLPRDLSPNGGFAIVLTDAGPLEEIHDEYRERFEDNIAAWDDSVTLFSALFEGATDAFLLADDKLKVVAANPRAIDLFGSGGNSPVNRDCRSLVAEGSQEEFAKGIEFTQYQTWSGRMEVVAADGETLPVQTTLRRVTLSSHRVYQIIVEDMSLHEELEERTAEVKTMNLALKKVIHTVEEEKQEIKEEMVQEMKDRVLPAVERIAESTSPEVRQDFKSVIHDQLAVLSEGTAATVEAEATLLRLTLREMQICRMIRQGAKGREIAEELDISFETLQTHRKNIRNKLGLKGSKISLTSFLANHMAMQQH